MSASDGNGFDCQIPSTRLRHLRAPNVPMPRRPRASSAYTKPRLKNPHEGGSLCEKPCPRNPREETSVQNPH
eukprot:5203949-Pyramimonas_sp.AAC.1